MTLIKGGPAERQRIIIGARRLGAVTVTSHVALLGRGVVSERYRKFEMCIFVYLFLCISIVNLYRQ